MEEEAEKDYQLASGLSDEVESDDSSGLTAPGSPGCSSVCLGGWQGPMSSVGSTLNGSFHGAVHPAHRRHGGQCGVQSAAIVVQGLASGKSPTDARLVPRLLKELSVALLNGAICAGVIMGASLLLGYGWNLSLTVSMALIAVIIFAALFGTFVPLTLDKLKVDPALATGPFITTANDIIGLIIYFGIGVLMSVGG